MCVCVCVHNKRHRRVLETIILVSCKNWLECRDSSRAIVFRMLPRPAATVLSGGQCAVTRDLIRGVTEVGYIE